MDGAKETRNLETESGEKHGKKPSLGTSSESAQ